MYYYSNKLLSKSHNFVKTIILLKKTAQFLTFEQEFYKINQ
jgi:hypothetical protein